MHLTGLQALARLPLDQVRRDREAGRRTGAVISGYPGSPLAGFDQTLHASRKILEAEDVYFVPGINEELAAAAVAGTQLIDLFPHREYDGVLGMWFGKAPGLDRSLDVLRHANFVGTARFGGSLVVVGDDPFCKSSSLPSHSEHAFAHAMIPLLAPADAQEILELGLHAYAISRYSGLWTGLKIVADVADGGMIFDLAASSQNVQLPKFEVRGKLFQKRFDPRLLPPYVNRIEEDMLYERLEAVRRYAFANGLNPITVKHDQDRIGILASGRLYRELETALRLLGLDAEKLEQYGIRIMKLQLVYPLDPQRIQRFADGLDEILVVDERVGFIEDQLRALLYNTVDPPMVLGQRNEVGEPWLARHKENMAETLALDLGEHLAKRLDSHEIQTRTWQIRDGADIERDTTAPVRTPVFCSGCPHMTSTRLPEGAMAGGGIGCHTMALLMDRDVPYIGAMGAEGAPWIGLQRFVDHPHLFQNLGDGTYFHSGRHAIRACVAAGVTMTFKLLYNGHIAMTGGQKAVGEKPVAEVVKDLISDGASKVVAMSDDRALRKLARHDSRVKCVTHAQWDQAMVDIQAEPGISVLVYDEICANQKQRFEKRGILPRPKEQMLINEDVCEGCGDCGKRSTCVSLRPVETGLGRKTRIHESSCSDDRSCLVGDCPSFVSVDTPTAAKPDPLRWLPESLPEPTPAKIDRDRFEVYFVGVGSTGIVTVDALLVHAAELEDLYVLHLDQTGLAQRGGKVSSHCIISREPVIGSTRVSWGEIDVLLACDPLSACDSVSLRALSKERTHVVAHKIVVPTAEMVTNPQSEMPAVESFLGKLEDRAMDLTPVQAELLAEVALGETLGANVVLLGAALQKGLLPVSAAALEQAVRDRGVAVESNLAAIRLGRAVIADPTLEAQILEDARPKAVGVGDRTGEALEIFGNSWNVVSSLLPAPAITTRQAIAGFAVDLADYQNETYARHYLETIQEVVAAESELQTGSVAFTETAARELYRLMAYKDEYEVARLQLRGPFRRWAERRAGRKLHWRYHLHPPLLRAMGLKGKLRFGAWFEPFFQLLAAMRWLRGTAMDPFGRADVRRVERELVPWYQDVLTRLSAHLKASNLERSVETAKLVERIRGYEDIKLEAVTRVRPAVEDRLHTLEED